MVASGACGYYKDHFCTYAALREKQSFTRSRVTESFMIAKVGNKLGWLDTASFDRSWSLSYLEVTPGSCIHLQRTAKERQIILCIIYFSDKHVSIVHDFAQPKQLPPKGENTGLYTEHAHASTNWDGLFSLLHAPASLLPQVR